MLEPCSASVSAETLGVPEVPSSPPKPSELEQPVPDPEGALLLHGHAVPEPSPAQKARTERFPPAGTCPVAFMELGVPGLHKPIVTLPAVGATSASKRKLYVVLQRSALALGFWARVSQA